MSKWLPFRTLAVIYRRLSFMGPGCIRMGFRKEVFEDVTVCVKSSESDRLPGSPGL